MNTENEEGKNLGEILRNLNKIQINKHYGKTYASLLDFMVNKRYETPLLSSMKLCLFPEDPASIG